MKHRNNSGPNTVPCGTSDRASAVSDLTPSRITCWLLWLRKDSTSLDVTSHPVMVELEEESCMRHLIKCLRKVQEDDVHLLSLCRQRGDLLGC